jgi:hypothetical protein
VITGLSPNEAVRRLLKLRARAALTIREPVSGATRPPLPYRFPLLGVSIAAPEAKPQMPTEERERERESEPQAPQMPGLRPDKTARAPRPLPPVLPRAEESRKTKHRQRKQTMRKYPLHDDVLPSRTYGQKIKPDQSEILRLRGLPLWVVYDHPADHPDHYIARKFVITNFAVQPTPKYFRASRLQVLQASLIRKGLTRLDRDISDDPVILETWL